jgi:hypothetical protein
MIKIVSCQIEADSRTSIGRACSNIYSYRYLDLPLSFTQIPHFFPYGDYFFHAVYIREFHNYTDNGYYKKRNKCGGNRTDRRADLDWLDHLNLETKGKTRMFPQHRWNQPLLHVSLCARRYLYYAHYISSDSHHSRDLEKRPDSSTAWPWKTSQVETKKCQFEPLRITWAPTRSSNLSGAFIPFFNWLRNLGSAA